MNAAAAGSLNEAVARASAVLGADPARAAREARAILKLAPQDPRARLILASALRRRRETGEALAILRPLAKAFPRAARTQYELGMVLGLRGDHAGAVECLRQAVAIDRALAEAWRALGDELFLAGEASAAEAAYAEHSRAVVTDPALKDAADALFEGRLDEAERRLTLHLRRQPRDTAAARMLGETFLRAERYAEAERVLSDGLKLDPHDHGARFSYATALFQQQKGAEALAEVERLVELDAAQPAYLNLLAGCLALVGDFPRVIETYEALLAKYDRQARVWLNFGHALRTVGRREDAVAAYRRALSLAPGVGDAYWGLANLKVATLSADDEVVMAAQLERADLDADDRLHLHYALGKALEDRGAYQPSFAQYAEGARLRRAMLSYDSGAETALMDGSRALLTPAFLSARKGWGSANQDPIFVVGLPRSGSTLIEQILASHSAVEGTMELPDIGFFASQLDQTSRAAGGPGYPACLAQLDAPGLRALGDLYIERTRVQRRLGRAFFIDKMPNNFRHVGLIHLILPQAKIIDARRHPLGVCFSAFKQHFAQGQAFSYDLSDLGVFYRDYVALMAHVDRVLPGRVCRVVYEDLVENTEIEVRRLLDYCGLPFEPGCLKFYENDRAVRTVSSEQVRQPIFRGGVDQWRRYEPWLGPLKAALGPALDGWRGSRSEPVYADPGRG